MKNTLEYIIEFILHLKYGEIYLGKNFSLKFPYFYSSFSQDSKQFVFVINNEIRYSNNQEIFLLRFVILGFGFDYVINRFSKPKTKN